MFAMVWSSIKQPGKIMRTTLLATLLTGLCIAFLDTLALVVFGEDTFQRAQFPLFLLIQQIRLGGVIENLDALGVLYFIMTSFFKVSLYVFASVRGIQQMTYMRNNHYLLYPVVFCILFVGMTMARSSQENIYVGLEIVPTYLWVPLFLILPAMLLIAIVIRKSIGKLNKGAA
jgi:spore germination protein KB